MLKDLDDVRTYTENLASAFPNLAEEIVFRRNGVSAQDLDSLRGEIGIPPMYSACASAWQLHGISLGFFALWPGFQRKSGLVTALRDINVNHNADASVIAVHSKNSVIVAREEADWICVGNINSKYPDNVFYADFIESSAWVLIDISSNFKNFILLAANLHKIAYSNSGDISAVNREMNDICEALGCNRGQTDFWLGKLSELIS